MDRQFLPLISFEIKRPKIIHNSIITRASKEIEDITQTYTGMRIPSLWMSSGGTVNSFPLKSETIHSIYLFPLSNIV